MAILNSFRSWNFLTLNQITLLIMLLNHDNWKANIFTLLLVPRPVGTSPAYRVHPKLTDRLSTIFLKVSRIFVSFPLALKLWSKSRDLSTNNHEMCVLSEYFLFLFIIIWLCLIFSVRLLPTPGAPEPGRSSPRSGASLLIHLACFSGTPPKNFHNLH